MIQRMSDQNKIKFLNSKDTVDENIVKEKEDLSKNIEVLAEEQKCKKINNKDNGLMNSHSVSSARTGKIKEVGGPSKYIKSETANTIWGDNSIEKVKEDNKEKTIKDKKNIENNKREAEQERMNKLVDILRSVDQSKSSNISRVGTFEGGNYKNFCNNMSIFDEKDFQRIPEKTAGEKVSEETKIRNSQQDESWRGDKKSVTTKEVISDYFNKLLQKREL